MLFDALDIGKASGLAPKHRLQSELARHEIDLRPRRVGHSNFYDRTDLALAYVLGQLRQWGVTTSKAALLLKWIDRDALEAALNGYFEGTLEAALVGLPPWDWEFSQEFSAVFTSREAALAALAESDLILIDVASYVSGKERAEI